MVENKKMTTSKNVSDANVNVFERDIFLILWRLTPVPAIFLIFFKFVLVFFCDFLHFFTHQGLFTTRSIFDQKMVENKKMTTLKNVSYVNANVFERDIFLIWSRLTPIWAIFLFFFEFVLVFFFLIFGIFFTY